MKILVTGGSGYIGSHTVIELVNAGHDVMIADNYSNSSIKANARVNEILGKMIPTYQTDIRNRRALEEIFSLHSFDCCIHFAGLKSPNESISKPYEYYDNNFVGTMTLVDVMRRHGCKSLIFSSSASVYGDPEFVPITESCPKGKCVNPYARTKSMIEDALIDLHEADVVNHVPDPWNIVLLRYFNPIGAHPSGRIGEDPCGIPNNLMPYITQVASGKLEKLTVYGDDYDTPDGTGVRDYIHVVDLARGHVKALSAIENKCGAEIYNLGTGKGCSVMELIKTFEEVNSIKIPYVIGPRRPGDVATCYSDPSKANRELGWYAEKDIADMCRDSWNWQKNNPYGY